MGQGKLEYSRESVEKFLFMPPGSKILGCWFEPPDPEGDGFEGHNGTVRFLIQNEELPDTCCKPKLYSIKVYQQPDGTIVSEFAK